MVEGHSVHRVAHALRARMVGRRFKASSPNGRFADGAALIDGRRFEKIEAVGKNLFAFFVAVSGSTAVEPVVMHVHFGMAGVWSIFEPDAEQVPDVTPTTRLRLEGEGLVSHLSAMTVAHGGLELYEQKRAALGHDPLRDDADPDALWERVRHSAKSIGQLLMDQSYFTGPGNIYRAEILFVARVHPEIRGRELEREQFDRIWTATVALLRRGFATGSILTVEPEEAARLGKPELRRFIYNRSRCGVCDGSVVSWDMSGRTCYACPRCQPRAGARAPADPAAPQPGSPVRVFNSHCAREPLGTRLGQGGGAALTVAELRAELERRGAPKVGKKAELVARLDTLLAEAGPTKPEPEPASAVVSAEAAAMEKARAGENRAVEHVAELAPEQARRAVRRAREVKVEQHAEGGGQLRMRQSKVRRGTRSTACNDE